MASTNDLFAFEEKEADSARIIFEKINKELGEYLLEKISTLIQQTAYLTS